MSPRSYAYIWMAYFAVAGLIWLGGAMTLVAIIAFGFISFGFVFMGMMCVLPTSVSHPEPAPRKPETLAAPEKTQRRRSEHARLIST